MCPELTLKVSKFTRMVRRAKTSSLRPASHPRVTGFLVALLWCVFCLQQTCVSCCKEDERERERHFRATGKEKALGHLVRTHEMPHSFYTA